VSGTDGGQIVTFYSYKGGTGRSMLLANVAWILASNGSRVLAVDWDLEAPGLHKYFQPFLVDKGLTETEGVIDFVTEFATAARDRTANDDPNWFDPFADMAQYAVPLEWEFDGGRLDFVGAGRQGASYSIRVNSFDWHEFYDRLGGGVFLARARQHLKDRYDHVLIDSRTGLSDTSGICTVQMPDALAVCFTLNNQSVEGAADVARSVRRQRGGDLRILTVPMRIDNSEKAKLDLRRQAALETFAGVVDSPAKLERQWAEVEVVYQAFYAYEEILATFGDAPGRSHTILAAAECVAAWVSDGEITSAVRISESRRREVLATYEGTLAVPALDVPEQGVYISYRRDDSMYAQRLYDELERELGGRRVTMDVELNPGVDFVELVGRSVRSAAVVLAVIGPKWFDRYGADERGWPDEKHDVVQQELTVALDSERRVVPVLVGGASVRQLGQLPSSLSGLARRQAVELSDSRWSYDVRRLAAAVELAIADTGRPPQEPSAAPIAYRPSASSEAVINEVLKSRRMSSIVTVMVAIATVAGVVSAILILLTGK
jgi:cellulose biosynthesis protein BcsQ